MEAHWKKAYVTANGAQMHVTRTGDGSKPPLVLLHGFSDNGLCWLPVARDLEAEWDVILPDARGHGLSERVQPGQCVDLAADAAAVIEALELGRPVVGGHSMGGSTAAQLAARYPRLVRGLILEDPAWFDPMPQQAPHPPLHENPWFSWLLSIKGTPAADVMAKGRADNPTWPEIEMLPWAESKLQLDTNVFTWENPRAPWRDSARAILCQTLLLTGEPALGGLVGPETAQEVAQFNPLVKVAHINGAGHNLRRENYADYMRAVREFLKDW